MKQPKGLGRGLDAIFGTEGLDLKAKPMSEMTELAIEKIIPNPTQPRTAFDEEALDELADSIRQLGIIQPITVRRSEEGRYIIISGERRWRAAQRADLKVVPVYIRDVDDENLHAMALVENIQRQDLNAIEIALGMKRLIEECNLTQDALSEKVGKKRSSVANYLRLLNLPNEVQLALKEGLISMGHAKAIAGAAAEEQLRVLKKCLKKSLSVRQTEELVRALAEKAEKEARTADEEEYPESYTRLVEQLERLFTSEIAIKRGKNGGGKITIGFTDDAQIEQIIERLNSNQRA
ncbi:MAG: ParB/RepB/Spo0J family partition protein [Alistipes sp.]|nr:ParB/RepB/Spo0J family partition protein [Rikenellaceae bacterium]MBQ3083081.1 ParB/RepB/Spo0J family partition protein [Alistipes sp.]MBQ8915907.1 ParB/RepB/Spo0J family partition protein [Alistipes sp.]